MSAAERSFRLINARGRGPARLARTDWALALPAACEVVVEKDGDWGQRGLCSRRPKGRITSTLSARDMDENEWVDPNRIRFPRQLPAHRGTPPSWQLRPPTGIRAKEPMAGPRFDRAAAGPQPVPYYPPPPRVEPVARLKDDRLGPRSLFRTRFGPHACASCANRRKTCL